MAGPESGKWDLSKVPDFHAAVVELAGKVIEQQISADDLDLSWAPENERNDLRRIVKIRLVELGLIG